MALLEVVDGAHDALEIRHTVPITPNRFGVVWGRWLAGPTEAPITEGNADNLYAPNEASPIRREWGGDYRLVVDRPSGAVSWEWQAGKPWAPVTLKTGDPSLGSRARLFDLGKDA